MGGIFLNNKFYYTFLPLNLIYDSQFSHLSVNAIILYSLMLNRKKLSVNKPEYNDKNGTFIFFSNPQIQKALRCNQDSARKTLNQLESAGLIRKEYQKQGLPLKIYVNDILGIQNRTYNKNIPQDKPIQKHKSSYKSSAPYREKETSFDINQAEEMANNHLMHFAEKKKKRKPN